MSGKLTIDDHNRRKNRSGESVWYVNIYGRRRKIVLRDDGDGNLLLWGSVRTLGTRGTLRTVIRSLCPVEEIIQRFGEVSES